MVVLDAPSQHHGGVVIFYQESPLFAVEDHHKHGLGVVMFQLDMGYRCWFIMGFYLAPEDASSIEHISGATEHLPCGVVLMVVGDLNANIADPESNRRYKAITESLSDSVLEYISVHFFLCRIPWAQGGRTCSMIRQGKVVQ